MTEKRIIGETPLEEYILESNEGRICQSCYGLKGDDVDGENIFIECEECDGKGIRKEENK